MGVNMGEMITRRTDIVPIEKVNNMMTNHFHNTTFKEMMNVQNTLLNNVDNELVSQGEEPAHYFTNGMYMRSLSIPTGELICGKTHRYSHFTLLTRGHVIILDEKDKATEYRAPCQWVSQAGVKRFIYAYEDSTIITVHKTDKLTPEDAEEDVIIKEYNL